MKMSDLFEEARNKKNKLTLVTKSGRQYEGVIVSLGEDYLEFTTIQQKKYNIAFTAIESTGPAGRDCGAGL